TESLRTKVSVARKRNFEGRDKAAETAVKIQKRRCGDRISLNNPAHSGVFGENREISVRPRVRGGGRSLYRTGLQPSNSLLAGKRTGNFAQSGGLPRRFLVPSGSNSSDLQQKFPRQANREFFALSVD